jgi:hypothetical protein
LQGLLDASSPDEGTAAPEILKNPQFASASLKQERDDTVCF